MKMNKNSNYTINIVNVSKNYGTIEAIKNVSIATNKGDIIALLGPNGAGKSTLMNMVAGYLSPTSGNIFVNGNDVEKNDIKTKKDIGFLSEGSPLYQDMTVICFLKYMIQLKLGATDENELKRIIDVAKIENVKFQKIETLSKGFLRRVGFAQSIIGNPDILLLDEPTDGLDPNQKDHMKKLIKELGKEKTIIISTHLLDEAESVANRVILINQGKIIIDGTVKDILNKTKKKTLEESFKLLTYSE
ncbi:MAG: ABC transporter ATP-binding protein [Alphaproteobacteria bacterium]|nr:ABC transporter ATP-binding protein [Alphaproteobacteria bacterium]